MKRRYTQVMALLPPSAVSAIKTHFYGKLYVFNGLDNLVNIFEKALIF